MTQIYGAVQHSLVAIYDRLKPIAKRREVKIGVADKELPKAAIILFPSFRVFQKFAPELNN